MIVKDRAMVPAAERAYPGASVLVIDPSDAPRIVDYVQSSPHGAPHAALSLAA
jgi:hypothetical protein